MLMLCNSATLFNNKMKTLQAISSVSKGLALVLLLSSYQCSGSSSSSSSAAADSIKHEASSGQAAIHRSANDEQLASSASAPHSITRLHQIWTSTSSDRLDELSPELISKMKANVPFLEAYALRPRLVGATSESHSIEPAASSSSHLSKQQQAEPGAHQPSNLKRANYGSPRQSPVGSLSGFSELKVESASLSRTEHRHKRTTSFKRPLRSELDEVSIGEATRDNLQGGPSIKRRKRVSHSANWRRHSATTGRRRGSGLFQDSGSRAEPSENKLEAEEEEVKGGWRGGEKKRPFYANGAASSDGEGKKLKEDEEEEEEEESLEPQRVGDQDVDEEEGDTVMVEPKSDGVADDPELPDYEDESSEDSEAGKRVNRAGSGAPDESGTSADEDENNDQPDKSTSDSGSDSGAGVGESTGGKAASEPVDGGDSSSSRDAGSSVTPGVERADGDFLGDSRDAKRNKEEPKSLNEDSDDEKEGDGEDEEGEEQSSGKGKPVRGNSEPQDTDDDTDDYGGSVSSDDGAVDGGSKEAHRGRKGEKNGRKHSTKDDEEEHEHEHESAIECLEDAVPGEPGLDYPILSRVNATSFRCAHYTYPGYYADTETRCQVFHYCGPDGTQDSFLCPNGTIFSQKASVCVWWNSFQCEDASKYVGLNALLYKQLPPQQQQQQQQHDATHPIDGSSIQPTPSDKTKTSLNPHETHFRHGDVPLGSHDGGKTSKPKPKSQPAGAFNEAAVQRKSPVPDEADHEGDELAEARRARAARLSKRANPHQWKATNNNIPGAAPRRMRRASTRQAPPKLRSSSRRYMRPSRRVAYRIKNVSKPRRRS